MIFIKCIQHIFTCIQQWEEIFRGRLKEYQRESETLYLYNNQYHNTMNIVGLLYFSHMVCLRQKKTVHCIINVCMKDLAHW